MPQPERISVSVTRQTSLNITARLKPSLLLVLLSIQAALVFSHDAFAQNKTRPRATATTNTAAPSSAKSITVRTESKAIIWLDEVRRGVTDDAGRIVLNNVASGRHTLRVRAGGFKERTLPVLPAQRGAIEVRLTPTSDEAELAFQKAEATGEKPGEEARNEAINLYRRALELRPRYAEAHLGLARVLLAMNEHDAALAEITAARRARPVYPEASAVEGRVHRDAAYNDEAIASYQRAIREARGFQPEAHTGLGLVLEDKGDYEGAVKAFRKAIEQLSDTEPVLYNLIGAAYEKLERWKDALAAYEKYLQLAPEGRNASAIRSIIDQLRVQAAEQQQQTPPR
jgi:tetratricopeptide (TPR) repeat protein